MCSCTSSVGVFAVGGAATVAGIFGPRALDFFNPFAAAVIPLVGLTTFFGGEDPRTLRAGFTARPRLDFLGVEDTMFSVWRSPLWASSEVVGPRVKRIIGIEEDNLRFYTKKSWFF